MASTTLYHRCRVSSRPAYSLPGSQDTATISTTDLFRILGLSPDFEVLVLGVVGTGFGVPDSFWISHPSLPGIRCLRAPSFQSAPPGSFGKLSS